MWPWDCGSWSLGRRARRGAGLRFEALKHDAALGEQLHQLTPTCRQVRQGLAEADRPDIQGAARGELRRHERQSVGQARRSGRLHGLGCGQVVRTSCASPRRPDHRASPEPGAPSTRGPVRRTDSGTARPHRRPCRACAHRAAMRTEALTAGPPRPRGISNRSMRPAGPTTGAASAPSASPGKSG